MITAQLLRSWSACWSDEQIRTRLGNRTEVTPREVAADTSISVDDRLWVICKALWYLDEAAARYFAIETALSVAHLAGDEDDQAQFLGLMNDLMCAQDLPANQRAAAWAAARATAWAAARDAAWDTAWDTAWAAARATAWDAARATAWDTARATAWAADVEKSISCALSWLGEYADGWEEAEEERREA
jgi:hypothetical protein